MASSAIRESWGGTWDVSELGLEDIILAYMRQDDELTAGRLTEIGAVQ
jgi:hypothetical protein